PDETPHGGLDAPLLERGEDRLRVGVAAETGAGALQLTAKIQVVVHLAVEDQCVAPGRRVHRLAPGGRQVQNGEAAEAERDAVALIHPAPFVVGTAVRDRHDHTPRAGLQIGPAIRTARDYPRKTTHTRPRDNERIRCDAVTGAALPLSARG